MIWCRSECLVLEIIFISANIYIYMAQPARPNLQTLEQALEKLGELPARLDRLRQEAQAFRGILGNKLVRIRERIERVRARVGAQGDAVRELRQLKQRIREHAPTAQQLQIITNVIATINPQRLQGELTALEREVTQLEQRVGVPPAGGPPPPPARARAATSGGYMYSRRANSARAKRSATRKQYGKSKHGRKRKTHRRKRKTHRRKRKTHRRKRRRKRKRHHR